MTIAGLVIFIVVLALVLTYVKDLPQLARTLISIAIILLAALLLIDVLYAVVGSGHLLHC